MHSGLRRRHRSPPTPLTPSTGRRRLLSPTPQGNCSARGYTVPSTCRSCTCGPPHPTTGPSTHPAPVGWPQTHPAPYRRPSALRKKFSGRYAAAAARGEEGACGRAPGGRPSTRRLGFATQRPLGHPTPSTAAAGAPRARRVVTPRTARQQKTAGDAAGCVLDPAPVFPRPSALAGDGEAPRGHGDRGPT